MKITNKDDLRVKDRVRLSRGESGADGPITEIHRRGPVVLLVRLEGHGRAFRLEPEAVTPEEWGQPVWTLQEAERPEPKPDRCPHGQTAEELCNRLPDWVTLTAMQAAWDSLSVAAQNQWYTHGTGEFPIRPDYAAGVDAYARHVQRIRTFAESLHERSALRVELLRLIDEGPKS